MKFSGGTGLETSCLGLERKFFKIFLKFDFRITGFGASGFFLVEKYSLLGIFLGWTFVWGWAFGWGWVAGSRMAPRSFV